MSDGSDYEDDDAGEAEVDEKQGEGEGEGEEVKKANNILCWIWVDWKHCMPVFLMYSF